MGDNVNHPGHYTSGDVECIDAIRSALGPVLFAGYLWGNAIEYLWRWPRKNLDKDLDKLRFYVDRIQAEGYDVPAKYDPESGCMVPNEVLAVLECGYSVDGYDGTPLCNLVKRLLRKP